MIMVRIIMNVLPQKQKELMQTLLSMIDTAGKEKGCLSYDVFCDIDGKTVYNLIEEWETREDVDNHIRSERFSVLLGTRSLLARPLEMKIHTVSHSEGDEVVIALRGKGNLKGKENIHDLG
ncbi:MAG: antibiotic biosynthesis monooxygenase [Deltaproteobacteria bacterium]|nr:antibiotic biosynthesis monooxygenase [Deltaproteobacteria bacterium]